MLPKGLRALSVSEGLPSERLKGVPSAWLFSSWKITFMPKYLSLNYTGPGTHGERLRFTLLFVDRWSRFAWAGGVDWVVHGSDAVLARTVAT